MDPQLSARRKADLRLRIRTARRALADARRSARDAAVDARAAQLAERLGPGSVVSSYVPTRLEPGTERMLAAFAERGSRVLVPVVVGPDAALAWRQWRQDGPDLPPEALAEAALVLVPALAVDRFGTRLGQGGGHYDRSLRHADPEARLVAVVDDPEVVEGLPREPHDRRVGWALTPTDLVRLDDAR
ncbi:5-formyltetrahydrofolate cyclo-ligase [Segniliparus rugosus]|uniref:5-formyltetrahydrofolate cyclo-ligase n=1 Tax=Segniliparus rugosus (strain ATCC BAA-974 / DSM 45345 / CCUG 50838 / CIP 108380 / JCM 13579 / CDC 945) TaxID=679197 RepID=E5XR28_SEGRC|nr:5-formyltetrahydrofolate cyclo-ligase [Segniliparus rugosus]EFV13181.2 5-formyltetrahydrofolate cyclo-ligase [Segniliparus rugosus ATCC BAA-974]